MPSRGRAVVAPSTPTTSPTTASPRTRCGRRSDPPSRRWWCSTRLDQFRPTRCWCGMPCPHWSVLRQWGTFRSPDRRVWLSPDRRSRQVCRSRSGAGASAYDDASAVPRDAGDVADLGDLGLTRRQLDVVGRQHFAQHGHTLHQGEPGPDATAYAATEGDPGVARDLALEEPLGPEPGVPGMTLLRLVGQDDRRRDVGTTRQVD